MITEKEFLDHVKRQTAHAPAADKRGMDLLHAAIGLTSELQELQTLMESRPKGRVTKREWKELSDAWFYAFLGAGTIPQDQSVARAITSTDWTRNELISDPYILNSAIVSAISLCGFAEKIVFQLHDFDRYDLAISECLVWIIRKLHKIGDARTAWNVNVEKLRERYPNGFSAADSMGRKPESDK